MRTLYLLLLLTLAGLSASNASSASAQAEIVVTDDRGDTLRLAAPARRIISLAPHVTETLFAAGAGKQVVGVVEYSNFPPAARKVTGIGSYIQPDLEAIAALKPDLAIGWISGNSLAHVRQLRALGIPVFMVDAQRIDDVAKDLERYGRLAGTLVEAQAAADHFRQRMGELRARYAALPPVRAFYQIWKQPLMTVGGDQLISEVMQSCGGVNVFAALRTLAPTISVETVIAADPEAIIASGMEAVRPDWLNDWRRWPSLTAVRRDNLFFIPPDLIQRATPRLVAGTEQLCQQLEIARSRRP
ncbi:Periplasmic binding protein [Sterolibacterium denitrificans]|uniref:Periplasmic binding protein n=1 Tax=Sterolibacterium denitrificans TaxID=157592 RepID=A0A7Z7MTU8_9PROT|nr:cobalamin-binding protein [Sterolibacterium denitrificans]SMB21070.1 Periplasmic binding protein [Sterolibacterium denitrificans]